MCGICGIYRFNDEGVTQDQLQAMTARMIHRGPDDEGYYTSGPAGLGMRRLSIIDVEGGHQPIANEDNTIWVVMNGEIYNHIELRAELKAKGHQFRTSSDTEILVHLYEEAGTEAVHQLNGMFAFALYDLRKKSCWIVRDRLGVKPLFYAEVDQSLFFASDLDALIRALPSCTVDPKAFLRYLAMGYVPGPETIYQDIKKLPPGSWLWADPEGMATKDYWDVLSAPPWSGSVEEAADQLYELLTDAVNLQLRSDVPLGVFLSGGVDSSAVVALAANGVSTPLQTFTADFVGKGSEDVKFARVAANEFGTNHTEVPLRAADAMAALDHLMPFLDEPVADSALIPSYIISEVARSKGIKVLLTGAGGDEIFGGYHRHHKPKPINAAWLSEVLPAPLRSVAGSLLRKVDPERGLQIKDPRLAFGVGISGVSLNACQRILKKQSDFEQIVGCLCQLYTDISPNGNGVGYSYTRMLVDLRQYLVGDVLALTDKATMGCSVEGRVPLLDHRLVEFAFSLPPELNLLEGKPKGLLRLALGRVLPQGLIERKKEGFNAPMNLWVLDEFGDVIDEELLVNPIPLFAELLDTDELRSILKDKRNPQTAETIFSLFIFSRWYRAHVEK